MTNPSLPPHVAIGENSWKHALSSLEGYSQILFLSDPKVYSLYGAQLDPGHHPPLLVPEGERGKTIEVASQCWDALHARGADRRSLLVALGGGSITDLTGFVASCYLRGISACYLPTTLLAMVDASVGGKTGVNLLRGKNLVGTFQEPRGIFMDPQWLKTLPEREFRSGLAEVVKYGFILRPQLIDLLENQTTAILAREPSLVQEIIENSVAVKWEVVCNDRKEQGQRVLLNWGHTFGHALETLTGYTELTHGEAVALGMSLAAHLASLLGLGNDATIRRLDTLLTRLGLPTQLPPLAFEELIPLMRGDKKAEKGALSFVIVTEPGQATPVKGVDEQLVMEAIKRKALWSS